MKEEAVGSHRLEVWSCPWPSFTGFGAGCLEASPAPSE